MSFTAALLMIAQSAAPALTATPVAQPRAPVAVQVSASARVLRPARIGFTQEAGVVLADEERNSTVQRSRDAAGTYWVEFS